MIWVIIQAFIFSILILAPFETDYDVPELVSQASIAYGVLGLLILLRATYDLRKSLAISPEPVKNGHMRKSDLLKSTLTTKLTSNALVPIGHG